MRLFISRDNSSLLSGKKYEFIEKLINQIFFVFTAFMFIISLYDIGFTTNRTIESLYQNSFFRVIFPVTGLLYLIRSIFFTNNRSSWKVFITNSFMGGLLIFIFLLRIFAGYTVLFKPMFFHFTIFHFLAFILFFLEISRIRIEFMATFFNPAQLFAFSFGFIIIIGTFLLLMPQSTVIPITFTDAFFTSTSAVCVTGLTVVDTATQYTTLGKLIIISLIQIGGIGVMTITSFFGYFFKETSSFREQMLLREYLSTDSINGIIKTLIKVILITIAIEFVGAIFIYFSLVSGGMGSTMANIRFSLFHSVSAFCNAGFSTLTDNLYDHRIRENYFLQISITNLIILGGLGFPVFLNLYNYVKAQVIWVWEFIKCRKPYVHRVGMITFNTKIVVYTTLILLIFGTVSFYLLEYSGTQSGADSFQRIAMSWFLSVTPRTAGFNTVNMELLTKPTLLILIFLMWVGASPVSTGGGIKTSTFIIIWLNVVRIVKGKNHIEILHREIHEHSVNKAFSIVIVSLTIIFLGAFVIFLIDGEFGLFRIVFECFSAFGTVGLSINLTSFLSVSSKWILILLMFLGRMGVMTLLLSLTNNEKKGVFYRYPKENLIIT